MDDVIVQKIWEVGKTPVVTIPKEVRMAIPDLTPGNYVKVYISRGKMVVEPFDVKKHSKNIARAIREFIEDANRREEI